MFRGISNPKGLKYLNLGPLNPKPMPHIEMLNAHSGQEMVVPVPTELPSPASQGALPEVGWQGLRSRSVASCWGGRHVDFVLGGEGLVMGIPSKGSGV